MRVGHGNEWGALAWARGGAMTVRVRNQLGCSNRINKGTCDNRRTILFAEIEARVLGALERHLLAPDLVAAAVEAYRAERQRGAAERAKRARDASRDLAGVDGRIKRVVDAIELGNGDPRALSERLQALERERLEIMARAPVPIADDVLALHPNAAKRYRQKVENIGAALSKGDAAGQEAVRLVRELISRIVVRFAPGLELASLEIQGDLAIISTRRHTISARWLKTLAQWTEELTHG